MTKPIMILATNGFEQSELEQPVKLLREAGYTTVVVSPEKGEIRGWDDGNWGAAVKVECALEDADEADFSALVLPGGQINPDILRMEEKAIQLVQDFCDADKPVAAICHGPWLLAEADVIDGRQVTSWPSIRTDLENAGAEVEDAEVVVDGNLITSRKPDDIPAFTKALIAALREQEELDNAA